MLWSLSSGCNSMPRRIFYGGLVIGSLAMLLFVAGFVSLQLGLVLLMGLFYLLASKILLLALVVLALLGLAALIKAIGRELLGYFDAESAALRRLLSLQRYRQDARQQAVQQQKQLHYWALFKRQRLLAANNRKHLRALSAAIEGELRAGQSQLTPSHYQSLRKALRQYYKRADVEAMLALRQQIPCP